MALSRIFKLNNLKHLSDTRYAAGMGVEFLGLSVDTKRASDESYLSICQELIGWVLGPSIIIEDEGLTLEDLTRLKDRFQFDGVESHNLDLLSNSGLLSIWNTEWSPSNNLGRMFEAVDKAKLLKGLGGIHISVAPEHELALIEDIRLFDNHYKIPILIRLPFVNLNFMDLLPLLEIHGFSMESGIEDRPGFKDLSHLMDVLELLEVED